MYDLLVNIDVADLESALRFYTSALPLQLGRRLGPDMVELLGSKVHVYLLRKGADMPPFRAATQRRSYERHWTPVHLDFVVPELEPALARAVAAGAVRESVSEQEVWGRFAALADPWGNGFCLVEFSAQGYGALATP